MIVHNSQISYGPVQPYYGPVQQVYYTGTATTNNTIYWPVGANPSAPPPAPVDKSPAEYQWLRRRVREITDLAPKL